MIDNSDYTQPLHNLLGRIIDVSLIWELFYNGNNTVVINGHDIAYFVKFKDYKDLEKHFITYKRLHQSILKNESSNNMRNTVNKLKNYEELLDINAILDRQEEIEKLMSEILKLKEGENED